MNSDTRVHKIISHYGTNDYYKYYRETGGTLSRKDFGKVLREFNLKIAEEILNGYIYKMPQRMGTLAVSRKKEFVGLKEGKPITNRPIDFKSTLEMWEANPEAKAMGKLVRFLNKHTDGWIYKVAYNKFTANYKGKSVYSLQVNRWIKRALAKKIFAGFKLEQLHYTK